MSPLLRLASGWICDLLLVLLPKQNETWAHAVRAEIDNIPEDGEAFLFVLDVVRGVALLLVSHALCNRLAALSRSLTITHSGITHMANRAFGGSKTGRVGIACATGAVCLGLLYLFAAGAPILMLTINAGALILGLATVMMLARAPAVLSHGSEVATLVMSCTLLLTALSGTSVDGASRWITLGSLAVQPSLILLPVIVLMFARDRGPIATGGVLIAALAMGLQPDRAMAGVLMCGLTALAIARRDRFVLVALVASVTAFVVTMVSPDRLPAVPYVDHVLYTAFDVHVFAGVAVAAGAALLLVPALYGLRAKSLDRSICMTFTAVWFSIIAAAALGNYPTPVVGYGGSAILGYLFSLLTLHSLDSHPAALPADRSKTTSQLQDSQSPFVQLA